MFKQFLLRVCCVVLGVSCAYVKKSASVQLAVLGKCSEKDWNSMAFSELGDGGGAAIHGTAKSVAIRRAE